MPKNENNTVTLEFTVDKTTPGTVRFRQMTEPDERPHTFYMLKDLHAQLGSPDQIVMTIETD